MYVFPTQNGSNHRLLLPFMAGLRGLQLHSVAQKADQEGGTVQFLGSKFGRPSRSDLGSK